MRDPSLGRVDQQVVREFLGKFRIEAVLFRHDGPAVLLPQVRIDFKTIIDSSLALLKALPEPVACLTADVVVQALRLLGRQRALYPALRYAPELSVTDFGGEEVGKHFLTHAVILTAVGHQARPASSGLSASRSIWARSFCSAAMI